MPRILIRSAKNPWTPVQAEAVLSQSVHATNAGNLLFGQAVHRMLSTPHTEVVPNNYETGRKGYNRKYVDRINSEFDHFVIPLANAFRPGFKKNLERLTAVVRELTIPVTVIGVGSQHELGDEADVGGAIDEDAQNFVSAVLDRSASIGVRGTFTAEYLKKLGFGSEHVDVIGCPSVFFSGPSPAVENTKTRLTRDSKIAMSVSPYVEKMQPIVEHHTVAYPHLMYIPQNAADLQMLLWGESHKSIPDLRRPIHTEHPLYLEDRMRYPLDPRTWIEYLQDFEFAFGTRIHGTIAAILAGVPTMLLAHDSRTLELAEYHKIPHIPIDQISEKMDAKELIDSVDYTEFNANLPETFDRLTRFFERNNLDHIYQPGNESDAFDRQLAGAQLPPMVGTLNAEGKEGHEQLVSRVRWLRQNTRADRRRTAFNMKLDFPYPTAAPKSYDAAITSLEKNLSALRKEIAGIQDTLAAQEKINGAPKNARRSPVRRVFHKIKRSLKR